MMMKMVGCLGYVGKVSEREKGVCYGFHIKTVEGNGCFPVQVCIHSLKAISNPSIRASPTHSWKKEIEWSTSTIILTVYFSVVVAHTLILL